MLTRKPRIGLTGSTDWLADLLHRLRADDTCEPVHFQHLATLIDDVLDHYPVLVFVDGESPGWQRTVTALKTEQATRRLPVIVAAGDTARTAQARNAGADVILPRAEIDAGLLTIIDAYALRLDPALLERLLCQCAEPLPALAREGVEKFNKGAFYAQHDAFEDQWMDETGPVRELYRAVLQVGVAYYHITRGNHAGGLKMLRRVVQWFARLPDECQGIDVKQLREDAAQVRAALAAMDPAEIADFDRALFKPVPLVED